MCMAVPAFARNRNPPALPAALTAADAAELRQHHDVSSLEENGERFHRIPCEPRYEVPSETSNATETDGVLKRLELENSRLRRLVADMLLDNLRLEDE
jgi:hypothetical protein